MRVLALILGLVLIAPAARAEDGYDLWLRYRPVEASARPAYAARAAAITAWRRAALITRPVGFW